MKAACKRIPEVGVDCLGEVCDRHGLRIEATASTYLRMGGHREGQEDVQKPVGLAVRDAGTNRSNARAEGTSGPDNRRGLGGNAGPLDSTSDDCPHRGLSSLFSDEKRRG